MHTQKLNARQRRTKILVTIVMVLFTFTMVFPLLWMLSTSFKIESEVFSFPIKWITPNFNLNNYAEIWSGRYDFLQYYLNTIKVTVIVVVVQLVISSMAAYAFAKLDFVGKGPLFALFLATMMIPTQVTLVPQFMLMVKLKLYNTHAGLILLFAFSVYGVFLLKQGMMSIPDSLVEAAKIDGANHFTIFSRIIVPMSQPFIATLAVMRFIWTWNDYQIPLVFLRSPKLFTLQLGMSAFSSQSGVFYSLLMAASVCAIVPLLIVFICSQKFVIEGMTAGAVKG